MKSASAVFEGRDKMSESVYVDLWKKIDENYMTAPADAANLRSSS